MKRRMITGKTGLPAISVPFSGGLSGKATLPISPSSILTYSTPATSSSLHTQPRQFKYSTQLTHISNPQITAADLSSFALVVPHSVSIRSSAQSPASALRRQRYINTSASLASSTTCTTIPASSNNTHRDQLHELDDKSTYQPNMTSFYDLKVGVPSVVISSYLFRVLWPILLTFSPFSSYTSRYGAMERGMPGFRHRWAIIVE